MSKFYVILTEAKNAAGKVVSTFKNLIPLLRQRENPPPSSAILYNKQLSPVYINNTIHQNHLQMSTFTNSSTNKANKYSRWFINLFFICSAVLFTAAASAQTTYFSKASATDFSNTATWGPNADGSGIGPVTISTADNFVVANNAALTLSTATVSVRSLTVTSGSLTVNSGTLNINKPTTFNTFLRIQSPASFTVAGGTVNLNGQLFLESGGFFNQSGGNINIDGNNGGTASGSVTGSGSTTFSATGGNATGSIITFAVSSTASVNLTGGTLTVIDPSQSGNDVLYFSGGFAGQTNTSPAHTWNFGDGVSTDAGGSTGFNIQPWVSTTGFRFGTVNINGGNAINAGTNRFVGGPTSFGALIALGNVTIFTNSEWRCLGTSTPTRDGGFVGGNLINNGTLTVVSGSALTFGAAFYASSIAITPVPVTVAQTISGSGIFRNNIVSASSTANYGGLVFNNTSSAGVSFSTASTLLFSGSGVTNTGTNSGLLTFSNGIANLNGGRYIHGVSTATVGGTITVTNGGFFNGTITRWLGTATLTTSASAPGTATTFPFAAANGAPRGVGLNQSAALTTAGYLSCSYTDASGLATPSPTFTDAGYTAQGGTTINRITNANWAFSTANVTGIAANTIAAAAQTFPMTISPNGIILMTAAPAANGAPVICYATSSANGTHAAGAGTASAPLANRTGNTLANLTANTYYIGLNSAILDQYYTVNSGEWSTGSIWSGGAAPGAANAATITSGNAVTLTSGTANAQSLQINGSGNLAITGAGSTLAITGGTAGAANGLSVNNAAGALSIATGSTINVGTGATRVTTFSNAGTFTVSGGTVNVNGNMLMAAASIFNQSGGNINVDGNNGSTTAGQSVASGTPLVSLQSQLLNLTGGTITILNPHINGTTATNARALEFVNGVNANLGTGHTFQFGDGAATQIGSAAAASGFNIYTNNNSSTAGKLAFGNLTVNGSATGTNRQVSIQSAASTPVGVLGNLLVTGTNGSLRNITSTVALNVAGDVTVNATDTLANPGTLALQKLESGAATAVSVAQTVSGAGVYRNSNNGVATVTAAHTNVTINNTNASGVTFSGNAVYNNSLGGGNAGTHSGTLTFTTGTLNVSGANPWYVGHNVVTAAVGTISVTAGGFGSGSTVARWMPSGNAGTTIAASTLTAITGTLGSGTFPFVSGTGATQTSRSFAVGRTTTTGDVTGTIQVTYNDVAGVSSTSVPSDGGYIVDTRTNSNWVVTTANGFAKGTAEVQKLAITGTGIFTVLSTNAIRVLQSATANPVGSTHEAGTLLPQGHRAGIPVTTPLAGTYYLGYNLADAPIQTQQSGEFNNPNTWVGNVVPSCPSNVQILNGHNVTISNGSTSSVNSIILSGTGTLNISSGTLNAGCTGNNAVVSLTGTSALTVSGTGNLNINGNLDVPANTSFNQSGGTVTVDGNDNGNVATSVATGTNIVNLLGTINLTGGTLAIPDPHVGTASSDRVFNYSNSTTVSAAGHTLSLGNGALTQATTNSGSFIVEPFASSGRLMLGNLIINTNNKYVTSSFPTQTIQVLGDLTITSGTYRATTTGTLAVAGNITNNGTLIGTGTLALASGSGTATLAASTVAQTVSGSGTFRNTLPTATVVAGGTGYAIGDILTLTTGTFSTPATFIVTGVSTGAVTTVVVLNPGVYTVAPTAADPATGGTGSGVTLTASNVLSTANFAGLTINNSNATGIAFGNANSLLSGTNTGTVSGTYTQTAGFVSTGSNALILGTGETNVGTLSYTAGGLTNGSSFSRWVGTATGGSTIVDGSNPSGSAGRFPFVAGTDDRSVFINQSTAPATGGTLTVKYNDAAGVSTPIPTFTDGAYTINRLTNANWVVSQNGITGAPAYLIAAVGTNLYSLSNANTRLSRATAVLPGAHVAGSTSPVLPTGQRSGVSLTDLTSTLYLGFNSDDIPFVSVASGNWEDGTTWNRNPETPSAGSTVTIAAGHTVTVGATAAVSNNLIVSNTATLNITGSTLAVNNTLTNNGAVNASGGVTTITGAATTGVVNGATTGVFTVNGGTVDVGITDNSFANRRFTNNGTLTVSSGNLNIYGNLDIALGSTFNQSGGNIKIDGNAAGVLANSVATGTRFLRIAPTALNSVNLTGGTLTIVDPHAGTSTSDYVIACDGSVAGPLNVTSGHTIVFGDGVSTDAGGSTDGFDMDTWVTTTGMPFGNVIINGPAGTNRHVSGAFQQPVLGNFTVNSGGESRYGTVVLNGNLTVNTGGTFTSVTSLVMLNGTFLDGSNLTFASATNPQSISGTGTFRNLTASPTANLTLLALDNTSAGGLTLNTPLSLSGALQMINGKINTTSTNLLTLGTATAAGTLTMTNAGSATNMIVGPFARTFAASRTATGATAALFPVGKGTTYLPISADPVTTAGGAVVLSGEAFTSNSGTQAPGVLTLGSNRWEALAITGAANLTSSYITIGDAAIVSTNRILQSTSAAGVYGPTISLTNYTAGTPNTLSSVSAITPYSGYFSYGDIANCTAPADQPSNLITSNLGSTSFNGSFTAASSSPTGYLVVRYLNTDVVTDPTDFTTYTVGGTLGVGIVVQAGAGTSFSESGLIAATTYKYYFYSFNNTACNGPVYNVTTPYNTTVVTCGTATGTPGTLTSSLITSGGFTATWTASSTPSVDYVIDVATDAGFTSFVAGYNGLNVGNTLSTPVSGLAPSTTYYLRVRAVTNPGGCFSVNSGTLQVATICASVAPPYTEGFESITVAGTLPACMTASPATSTSGKTRTYLASATGTNSALFARTGTKFAVVYFSPNAPGYFFSAPLLLTGGVTYTASVNYVTDGVAWPTVGLAYGTEASIAGMTNSVASVTSASATTYTQVSGSFTPPSTGTYYVAFFADNTSTNAPNYATFDDFSVKEQCVTPSAQPTALSFPTIGSGNISGSFTAASATGYLVLRTPAATAPSIAPVSGTAYTAGATLGNATVVSAAAGTTFSSTGLVANTTYRYTVYSYNDNCGGEPAYNTTSPLFGEATTLGAQTITSVASGSWKNPLTWDAGVVPSRNDFVQIASHTVTIDTAAVDSTLTISSGGTLLFDATTAYTLTSGGNVSNSGIFATAATGTQTGHQLIVNGNLSNSGTIDFSTNGNTAGARIVFAGGVANSTTTFTADGTVDLRTITVNKGTDSTSVLDITGNGFSVRGTTTDDVNHSFVTLTSGTLKLSMSAIPTTSRLFSAGYTIPAAGGLWLNSASLTVSGQSSTTTTVNGLLRITAGTLNVGTASGNSIAAGTGASFHIEGGSLNVAGGLTSTNDVSYWQTAGNVTVNTVGYTTSSVPAFGFTSTAVANKFAMSGGNIIIQRPSTATTQVDYRQGGGTVAITGGTVQFGNTNTPASSTFVISNLASTNNIVAPSIVVDATTNTKTLSVAGTASDSLLIYGDLTINTGSSLVHNNTAGQLISVLGNDAFTSGLVTNNGSITLGSGSTSNRFGFNHSGIVGVQTYTGTGSMGTALVPYPGLIFNNPSGVNFTQTGANIITSFINYRYGPAFGNEKITLGIGGTSAATIQVGGNPLVNAGGIHPSFLAPIFNVGTGGLTIRYDQALNAVGTGKEIPTGRIISSLVVNNTNNVTLNNGALSTTSVTLTAGELITTAANLLTVTGTTPANVTRTTGFVNGPLVISLPSGSPVGTFLMPVGKTAAYGGFELINPVTSAATTIQTEYFTGATGGIAGSQMVSLNEQQYWNASLNPALTSTRLRVTSSVGITPGTDALAQSSTLGGTYNFIGAASPNSPTGTISSADPTPLVTSLGYFTIGTKGIPMVYDSSRTFQVPGNVNVFTGSNNQLLIGVKISTTNNSPVMTLNSMKFNLGGSNTPNLDNNLNAVTLYTTGNSSTFAATTQVGDQQIAPFTTPPDSFVINAAIPLLPGDNYFWLTADVSAGATVLDTIDARCNSFNITDNNPGGLGTFDAYPSVSDPAGNRVIKAILNGDYSIGAGNVSGEAGHFDSLRHAILALNDVGVGGPVRFLLTDATYSTGNIFPITINAFANASAVNTLTISPAPGVNTTISGSSSTSIIKLNGADYVIIDGSNNGTTSRNLTITNTSTSSSTAGIWVASLGAGLGATNDVIKNTNVATGTNSSATIGIAVMGASISTTGTGADNDNVTIQNNAVTVASHGINAAGTAAVTAGGLDNLVITGNTVSSSTSLANVGIRAGNALNSTVSLNTVDIQTSSGTPVAISLENGFNNSVVTRNNVTKALYTGTAGFGGRGITVGTGSATSAVTLSNNFVSGVNGDNFSGFGNSSSIGIAIGIVGGSSTLTTTTGGVNLYFNTVNLTGAYTRATNCLTAALYVGSGATALDIRNNILVDTIRNTTASGTGSASKNYAIYSAAANTAFTNLNYNNYLVGANSQGILGFIGSDRTTLAAIVTGFGQNANSKNVPVAFVSNSDLHLTNVPANATNLYAQGTTIGAVANDIDNEIRQSPPTIGADELLACTTAVGGTIVGPSTSYCGSSPVGLTITASGYSEPINGSYQWQSSTTEDFAVATDIVGATNPVSYVVSPAVTTTTYYRLKVTCTSGTTLAYSNVDTVIIDVAPTPTFTNSGETVSGTVFCTPVPQAITLTAGALVPTPTNYQWKLNGADIGGANGTAFTITVPNPQTGNYSLSVTYANGCTATSATSTITASQRPTATATATPLSLCVGSNLTLTSTGLGSPNGPQLGTYPSSPTTIGYGPVPDPGGASLIAGDDAVSTQQTLPFTFNYFGTNYTSVYVSTNGFITLGTTAPGSAATNQAIPSTTTPNNVIAGVWADLYATTGNGVIRSYTTGTAGSRIYTVHYSNIPFYAQDVDFNVVPSGNNDFYIQLYEGSNDVEVHINNMDLGASLEAPTTGIENSAGTAASFPAGRNADIWGVSSPIAYRYSQDRQVLPIVSYAWSGPAGSGYTAAVQNPPAFAVTSANAGQYTVTVKDATGCPGNASTTAVVVNPLPTIAADSAAFRYSLNTTQTTTLPYTATGTPTTYGIVWDAAALGQGFANVPSGTVLPASPITINVPGGGPNAGTYTGTITVTNANNCVSISDDFTLIIANANPTWTGNTSNSWTTASNWSTGVVPAPGVNVTIDRIGAFSPTLQGNVTVGTMEIFPNNTVTLNGNTLTANGGILNNTGTLIGSNTSNLVLGASSTLRFATGSNVLKDLTINGGTTTVATPLDITAGTGSNTNTNGVVTVASGAVLASGGNLTFKSTAAGTARLATSTAAAGYVTGDVTVERYIPGNAQRAWRFLSVPTGGTQKIKQAWQEGGTGSNYNPNPGYGTGITSNVGPYATLIANGFDEYTAKASMQRWNQNLGTTGNWVDITATQGAGTTGNIATTGGYALYVRGDRTQTAAGAVTSTTPTTLRTKGTLYTGDQANISVGSGRFELIGNTYVSPIDFLGLNRVNMVNSFYLWDPKLTVGTPPNQTLGGYVTFSLANGFVGIPNSSSYGLTPNTVIQTGQAFLVQANAGGGSIGLREAAKVQGNGVNMFRPAAGFEKLKANLYRVEANSTETMADANVSVFDNLFSNAVDGDDAIKLSNSGENFAIRRGASNLVVEGRQVTTDYDTTYFWMWNLRQAQSYKLELIAENMNVPGRSAYLIDNFTGTTTQLDLVNGTTNYNFNITSDGLSSTATRFKVVYRQVELAPVPVSFISVNAQPAGTTVKVDWKVATESGIRQYVVERSSDGNKFDAIGNITASANSRGDATYSLVDATPLSGSNFYRIKSVGTGGEVKYSYIVKVLMGSITPSYTIAPNPVEGSVANIQFKNQVAGRYAIRLIATGGETVFTTIKEHAGGNSTQVLNLPSGLARGTYKIEITSPDKVKEVQNLFINTLK